MERSWNYLPGEMIEVRCYTNLDSVELFCNGKAQGKKSFDDETGYLSWEIPFEPGIIKAIGCLAKEVPEKAAEDTLESTGSACDIQLSLWDGGDLIKHTTPSGNLQQIEVTVTDMNGRRVVTDSTMLIVEVTGQGKLIGLENGDLADLTEYTANYRRAYEGRLIIYVAGTEEKGNTTVKVYGRGLKPATITL